MWAFVRVCVCLCVCVCVCVFVCVCVKKKHQSQTVLLAPGHKPQHYNREKRMTCKRLQRNDRAKSSLRRKKRSASLQTNARELRYDPNE